MGAQRVWLHTCNLDGPHALANYQKRGFRIYDVVEEPCPSSTLSGRPLSPRSARCSRRSIQADAVGQAGITIHDPVQYVLRLRHDSDCIDDFVWISWSSLSV